MSEPNADEADVVEQLQPVLPDDEGAAAPGPGQPLPDEAEVADVLEQAATVPGSDDDYPGAVGGEDDRA